MSRIIRICTDVLAFCLGTALISFPATAILLQLGFTVESLFDWGELYWASYLALRRGDTSLLGVISILWLFAAPFIALALFKPARNRLRNLLRKITRSPTITEISIGPREEAVERSRLTQSETLKPFDEALGGDKPRHAARALLAWYAAWVGLEGDSEVSRLCHDAVVLQMKFDQNPTEIEAFLPKDRVKPIRMALSKAVLASVNAPARGGRSIFAADEKIQETSEDEGTFERDPFLDDGSDLTDPEQKASHGVIDPIFDDPFFDVMDFEPDLSSESPSEVVQKSESAGDEIESEQEKDISDRDDNPFDDEPDDYEIQDIASMETKNSGTEVDEGDVLDNSNSTGTQAPQLWKLIEVEPDENGAPRVSLSVGDVLTKLERIDAEATSIVLERSRGGEMSLSSVLSDLVDLGIEMSLLDELARGRLTAALREPSRASQRSFRDLALKIVGLDKSAQLDLIEEELLKIETDLATDDEEDEF